MNVTKLTLLATLASVLLVNHPLSEATFGAGDDFLEWEQNSPLGQHQLSYVMGLYDAYELGALSLGVCVGPSVKASSMKDAVLKYLHNNPRDRNLPMRVVFPLAIDAEWRCKLGRQRIIEITGQ